MSIQPRLSLSKDNSLDPIPAESILFERKLSLPTRFHSHQSPQAYPIIFKVARAHHSDSVQVYILSDADLFFLYKIQVSVADLQSLNHANSLLLSNLNEFTDFFKECLQAIDIGQQQGLIEISSEQKIVFKVSKMYSKKQFIVLALVARKESDEATRILVAYRYGSQREAIRQKQEQILNLRQLVRLKNPYLLTHFKRF